MDTRSRLNHQHHHHHHHHHLDTDAVDPVVSAISQTESTYLIAGSIRWMRFLRVARSPLNLVYESISSRPCRVAQHYDHVTAKKTTETANSNSCHSDTNFSWILVNPRQIPATYIYFKRLELRNQIYFLTADKII